MTTYTPTIAANLPVMTCAAGGSPLWMDCGSLAEWIDSDDMSGLRLEAAEEIDREMIDYGDADRWAIYDEEDDYIGSLCDMGSGLTVYIDDNYRAA